MAKLVSKKEQESRKKYHKYLSQQRMKGPDAHKAAKTYYEWKGGKTKKKTESTASKIAGRKKRQSKTVYGALTKKEVDRMR